jgi:hypothetical protein
MNEKDLNQLKYDLCLVFGKYNILGNIEIIAKDSNLINKIDIDLRLDHNTIEAKPITSIEIPNAPRLITDGIKPQQ